jgi:acetyl-CoA carboxylase biotin carboxyl carrier protein
MAFHRKGENPLNVNEQFILSVMEKFNSSGISELELDDGNTRLMMRKESTVTQVSSIEKKAEQEAPAAVRGRETITSPIVGTFYSAPSPDSPPYAKPGAKIKTGEVLCILEAMKMMHKLEAEYDCEITEIHAVNGDLVEYGQALFTVKRL